MSHTTTQAVSRTALVLYGTETGNAQDVALEVAQLLQRLHFLTLTDELDNVGLLDLNSYAIVCIVISTTGQGEFPSDARKFWLSSLRRKLLPSTLNNVRYGLIGLCDSSYPKFNFAARKLDKRLRQLGAQSLLQPCEADEQGEDGTEGAVLAWLPLFKAACVDVFPLLEGQVPIPDQVRLPSHFTLAFADDAAHQVSSNLSNGATRALSSSPSDAFPLSFDVVLEKNERVTPESHWQDVRLLQLRSESPVQYLPGDALAISPQNSPDDVNQLLDLLGWSSVADKDLIVEQNIPHIPGPGTSDPTLGDAKRTTLRKLLTTDLDILAVPKRSFFANIAHFTNDETQKERAVEFTDPQYLDEYFDYATRPRRSILEVLQEFNTLKIPWTEALSIFPKLRSRQFSIASGGYQKEQGTSFDLLVAIVKYRTVIKRIRRGVCTKYLASLPLGTKLNVVLHTEGRFSNHPASIGAQKHLLIGGGTGIAPLRAIIHEKTSLDTTAQSVLFFGCRNVDSDFFFRDEWLQLAASKHTPAVSKFQLITAFSRDQAQKVYVQDKLREHEVLVREFLQAENTCVIVCGSSGSMPKAVRQALKDVLTTVTGSRESGVASTERGDSGLSETEAETFLAKLEKSGRYKQETW